MRKLMKGTALIVSHDDLDGFMSAWFASLVLRDQSFIPTVITATDPSSKKTKELIDKAFECGEYDKVIICDRAFPTGWKIPKDVKVEYYDHHIGSKDGVPDGVRVKHNTSICATKILADKPLLRHDVIVNFLAHAVDQWDTFKWTTCDDPLVLRLALMLNALASYCGTYDMFEECMNTFITYARRFGLDREDGITFVFMNVDDNFFEYYEEYVKSMYELAKLFKMNGNTLSCLTDDKSKKSVSMTSYILHAVFPNVKYVNTYMTSKTVSVRTSQFKEYKDGEYAIDICKANGGGGHKHAGGYLAKELPSIEGRDLTSEELERFKNKLEEIYGVEV